MDVFFVASCAQVLLLSQDYGKHLLGVEDLLQKHALVEADIGIQAERVRGVNASAQKFATDGEGKDRPFQTLPPRHQKSISRDVDGLCVAVGPLKLLCYCGFPVGRVMGIMRCSRVAFHYFLTLSCHSEMDLSFPSVLECCLVFSGLMLATEICQTTLCTPIAWCVSQTPHGFHTWLCISLFKGCLEGFGFVLF